MHGHFWAHLDTVTAFDLGKCWKVKRMRRKRKWVPLPPPPPREGACCVAAPVGPFNFFDIVFCVGAGEVSGPNQGTD